MSVHVPGYNGVCAWVPMVGCGWVHLHVNVVRCVLGICSCAVWLSMRA